MGLKDEMVVLNDPEEKDEAPEEPEEEEEEELEDPMDGIRAACQESSACAKLKSVMDACQQRVEDGSKENCSVELYDYVHSVDHCISKSLFSKLK